MKRTAGIGKTGVGGVLKNGAGPVVMFRSDMDALPVLEETGLPYASRATGQAASGSLVPVMHACGHDAHVVFLVGVAKIMTELKDRLVGHAGAHRSACGGADRGAPRDGPRRPV